MLKILVATKNKGKLHEIRALLADLPVELHSPDQIGLDVEVTEDGRTYQENATKKALAFAKGVDRDSGYLILADDSGLEVSILNGQPGLYSARYSKRPGATDADRRAYLLEQLAPHPHPWAAQFRCVVVLLDPDRNLHISEGICPGKIIPQERGTNGFGYDPIFQVEGLGRTMAELTTEEKNVLSHRARAILAIRPKLIKFINS
jgi:XTP/dITP diphosphohydrolase